MRPRISALVVVVLAVVSKVDADSVLLTPLDAQAETTNGVDWTIDPVSDALNASRIASGLERRGVLEFPLDAIPPDAVIMAVSIEIDMASIMHSVDEYPIIEFRGYAGDGVLTTADASQKAQAVGVTEPILSIDEMPVVVLDAAFVQSLLGAATHLGLQTFQVVEGRQAAFWSVEFSELFPVAPAQLTIEFNTPIVDGLIPITDRRDLVWDPTRE